MNLVVDVGNTRTKYAFFEQEQLLEVGYEMEKIVERIGYWKEQGKRIELFLSGSGKLDESIELLLKKLSDNCLEASSLMDLPLKIGYATPETLGFDRIAICVGAHSLFPGRPLLVIDTGTAITFNYVSEEGVFLGGNISPGMEMRFRGLHQFTARLPYVGPAEVYGGVGQTTEDAIRNGVMDGILFEVIMYVEKFSETRNNGLVLLTGGNSRFLSHKLPSTVQVYDYLGFIGLNSIFSYTKKD